MKPRMNVHICKNFVIKNPVMTASGTFGYGEEYGRYMDLNRLGGVIVKGISQEPRKGNPPPRIMETPCGMLNSIGLENVGVKSFIKEKLPFLRELDAAVIVNIFGETVEEYRNVAGRLSEAEGVRALEVNISCPNVKKGGIAFGTEPGMAAEVTRAVKKSTDLPVIVKLSPNVSDISVIARAVEDGGADALSVINTPRGMSVDVEKRIPHLKNITGGLSGPAIRPIALRMVWEVVQSVSIPVVGVGGIMEGRDALQFIIAGASAVQVGTASFLNPKAAINVLEGIEEYLGRHSMDDITQLIGSLKTGQ